MGAPQFTDLFRAESGGTESDEVLAECERLGLNAIQACSIIAVGVVPDAL